MTLSDGWLVWRDRKRSEWMFRRNAGLAVIDRRLHEQARARWLNRAMALPPRTLHVGSIRRGSPIRSQLLGLRFGTAHLAADLGSPRARLIVERAEEGDELAWETIGERPTPIDQAARPPIVELSGRAGGVEFSVGQAAMWRSGYSGGPLSVAAPTSGGTCSVVVLGQPRRSRTWLCWLVGLEMTAQPVEAALLDVHVRLQELKAPGPGGRLAPIVQLTLKFDQLTDVDVAERFLAVEVLGLLNLFAGRRIVPAGMWADDESGRLRGDFRGRLIAPPRRMVTSGLAAYVTQAFAGW